MEELKPIERLYLISKENKDVFSKRNRLYCLIYQLIESKNIIVNRKNFNVSFMGNRFLHEYEDMFLKLIDQKKYLDLDTFINNATFDKTLADNGYFEKDITEKKTFFIFNTAKVELKKTSKYFETQAQLHDELKNINVLKIVCPKTELELDILKVYNFLIESMQKANEEQKKKNKESNDDDIGNLFGINEK